MARRSFHDAIDIRDFYTLDDEDLEPDDDLFDDEDDDDDGDDEDSPASDGDDGGEAAENDALNEAGPAEVDEDEPF